MIQKIKLKSTTNIRYNIKKVTKYLKKRYNINKKVRISSNERYNFKPNAENVPQKQAHRPKIQKLPQNYTISIKKPPKLLYKTKKLKITSKLRYDIDKKLKITSQMNCNIDKKSQNIPQKYTMTSTKKRKKLQYFSDEIRNCLNILI